MAWLSRQMAKRSTYPILILKNAVSGFADTTPKREAIRRRELFARFGAELGRPDGAALDAADHYWIAGNDAWAVHRFAPSGALAQSIAMPVQKPSKPAFGGPDLRTLYVTSIAKGIADPGQQPDAGALFRVDAGVTGLPLTPFGG